MKNLMVFINPAKEFTPECSTLIKIQIDNCWRLGWKKEDILLVTNFDYEYNGVKAMLVGDENYCAVRPRSIKTSIIPVLIDAGIIEKGKIYWNHDFDAFQLNTIDETELELNDYDVSLTDYGWKPRWCMGSYFVKDSSRDIFELANPIIFRNIEDEDAMMEVTQNPDIAKRCKRLNITYNLGMRNVPENVERAIHPIKIVHFHPRKRGLMDVFKPIMPEGFINILNQHGYK